jgi:hypothetical protein
MLQPNDIPLAPPGRLENAGLAITSSAICGWPESWSGLQPAFPPTRMAS